MRPTDIDGQPLEHLKLPEQIKGIEKYKILFRSLFFLLHLFITTLDNSKVDLVISVTSFFSINMAQVYKEIVIFCNA